MTGNDIGGGCSLILGVLQAAAALFGLCALFLQCGAGGGQMWTDGEKRESPVQVIRLEELRKTGAKRIALACPHCLTMLETARAETKGDDVLVDIAEIVADRLEVGSEG